MYRYIASRLLLTIPTLIGAAAIVFLLMRLIPGDTFSTKDSGDVVMEGACAAGSSL